MSLKVGFEREYLFFLCGHDAGLLIVTHSFLEEVGLAFQTDVFHEVEGVLRVVVVLASQLSQKTIRHKFDIRFHSLAVHAKKGDWKCVGEEFLFDGDGVFNDG